MVNVVETWNRTVSTAGHLHVIKEWSGLLEDVAKCVAFLEKEGNCQVMTVSKIMASCNVGQPLWRNG